MADLELIDRIIRLGEVATAAPDDVRRQLVLTLTWINCPAVLTVPLGSNTEDASRLREMIILGEGYREPGAARAGCTCGARGLEKHGEWCPRRPLRDPVAEGRVPHSPEAPVGSRVMPATAERGVDGAAARHRGPPPPPPVSLG